MSRNTTSLALLQPSNYHRCLKASRGVFATTWKAYAYSSKRAAYPCRLSDLIPRFSRPVSVTSLISNDVIDYIYDVHGHRITQWNRDLLNPGALQRYAEAISGKGGPIDNCFDFVDGTVRPISRPNERQRIVYNGHKSVHALKFQSLSLPNGLIDNLFGPVGEFVKKKFSSHA